MTTQLQKIINEGSAKERALFIIEEGVKFTQGKKTLSPKTIDKIIYSCADETERNKLINYIDFAGAVEQLRFQLLSYEEYIKANSILLEKYFEQWASSLNICFYINLCLSLNVYEKALNDIIVLKDIYGDCFFIENDRAYISTEKMQINGSSFLNLINDTKACIIDATAKAKGWIMAIEEAAEKNKCIDIIPSDIAKCIENIKNIAPDNQLMNIYKEMAFFEKYGEITKDHTLFQLFCFLPCYNAVARNEECFKEGQLYF